MQDIVYGETTQTNEHEWYVSTTLPTGFTPWSAQYKAFSDGTSDLTWSRGIGVVEFSSDSISYSVPLHPLFGVGEVFGVNNSRWGIIYIGIPKANLSLGLNHANPRTNMDSFQQA